MKRNGGSIPGNWEHIVLRSERRRFSGSCESATGLISQTDATAPPIPPGPPGSVPEVVEASGDNNDPSGTLNNSHQYYPAGGPYYRYIVDLQDLELWPKTSSGVVTPGNPAWLTGKVEVALQREDPYTGWTDEHRIPKSFHLKLIAHLHP